MGDSCKPINNNAQFNLQSLVNSRKYLIAYLSENENKYFEIVHKCTIRCSKYST